MRRLGDRISARVRQMEIWVDHGLPVPQEIEVRRQGDLVVFRNTRTDLSLGVQWGQFKQENLPLVLETIQQYEGRV